MSASLGGLRGLHHLAHQDFERSNMFSRQGLILDALAGSSHPAAGVFLWSIHQTCPTPAAREKARTLTEGLAKSRSLTLPDFLDQSFPDSAPAAPVRTDPVPPDPVPPDPPLGAARILSLPDFLKRHLTLRFQQEMLTVHRRTPAQLQDHLLTKPLARLILGQLILGRYDSCGKLLSSFRVDEDGICVDMEDRAVRFGPGEMTGVLHPVEIRADEISAWREVLDDYQILQPFPQMQRVVCRATQGELDQLSLARFAERPCNERLLWSTFHGALWDHDKPQESGEFTRFFRNFEFAGISACVRHDPISEPWNDRYEGTDDGIGEPVRIHEIYFVKTELPKKAWRVAGNHLPIKQVHPLVLSEALWLAHQATGLPLP
jgi:hypothetical protein